MYEYRVIYTNCKYLVWFLTSTWHLNLFQNFVTSCSFHSRRNYLSSFLLKIARTKIIILFKEYTWLIIFYCTAWFYIYKFKSIYIYNILSILPGKDNLWCYRHKNNSFIYTYSIYYYCVIQCVSEQLGVKDNLNMLNLINMVSIITQILVHRILIFREIWFSIINQLHCVEYYIKTIMFIVRIILYNHKTGYSFWNIMETF